MDKNEPRMEFVFRGYNPKKWSLIKLFRTKEDEDQDDQPKAFWRQGNRGYLFIKCNGLISNLDYCSKCKIRFQCLTSREPVIVNEKLFIRMYNNNYTPLIILRNYLFNRKVKILARDKKTGRFCK